MQLRPATMDAVCMGCSPISLNGRWWVKPAVMGQTHMSTILLTVISHPTDLTFSQQEYRFLTLRSKSRKSTKTRWPAKRMDNTMLPLELSSPSSPTDWSWRQVHVGARHRQQGWEAAHDCRSQTHRCFLHSNTGNYYPKCICKTTPEHPIELLATIL